MKRVPILFQRQAYILPDFHGDSHQQAFLCHDQRQAYAEQIPLGREGKEENLNIAGGRGRIMNPSEEADHLKRKHERSKTKGSDVRDVLWVLKKLPCCSLSNCKTTFWSFKAWMLTLGAMFILFILAT